MEKENKISAENEEQAENIADVAIFYDPQMPRLLLLGAGHVSREVAKLAHYTGFGIDVMDMREEYLEKKHFPTAYRLIHCEDYAHIQEIYKVESKHYIAIVTHSFETDTIALRNMLHSPARYIGMAATQRKKDNIFNELRLEGFPDTELACVHCPMGLDIGATSAEEMAISIVAELIAARAGQSTKSKR